MRFNCKLVCEKGYWYVHLPFGAGTIDLGDCIQDALDSNTDLRVIDYLSQGMTNEQIKEELLGNDMKVIDRKIKKFVKHAVRETGGKDGNTK